MICVTLHVGIPSQMFFFVVKLRCAGEYLYLYQKTRRTVKEMLRRNSVQITVLFRTITQVVSVLKQGIF